MSSDFSTDAANYLDNLKDAFMPGGSEIYDEIIRTMRENGDLDENEHRRIVRLALLDIGGKVSADRADLKKLLQRVDKIETRLKSIDSEIAELKKNSIILIAKKYPKTTATISVVAGLLIIAVIAHLQLWGWLFGILGIPLP